MTEQERPRTEAEPIARLRRMMERVSGSDRWDPYIDAAVEAARAEGRQQADRYRRELMADHTKLLRGHPDPDCSACRLLGVVTDD